MTTGQLTAAREYLSHAREVFRPLLSENPRSDEAARNVSASLDRLGDFLLSRGGPKNAGEALRFFEESLAIRRRLHEDNPGSAQAASDLFYAINRMAFGHPKAGERGKAFRLGQCLTPLLEALEERGFDFDKNMRQNLSALNKH